MLYQWLKIFHIFMVTSWFAGIFYLPRIYVNLAQPQDESAYEAMLGMAKRLFRFTTIIGVLAIISGFAIESVGFFGQMWLLAKEFVVGMVVVYQITLWFFYRSFRDRKNTRSHVFFRWYNEVPVLFLLAILILVVLKPF